MTYTPTTREVRKAYAQLMHGWDEENVRYVEETEAEQEFDNWLAEELRKAKAQAWDEGHEDGAWNTHNALAIEHLIKTKITNPYRSQP